MAKDQGISLTPNEITGMCGRLRCCLIYEYEQYVEARKTLPKRNKRVITPKGEGKVIDVLPMSNKVMVFIETEEKRFTETFDRDDIQPWDELEALRRKSQAPCDRHDSGGCTCGKSSPIKENTLPVTRKENNNPAPRKDNQPSAPRKPNPNQRKDNRRN
jgi:hypothetical protein